MRHPSVPLEASPLLSRPRERPNFAWECTGRTCTFTKICDSPLFPDFVFGFLHRSETSCAFSCLWRVPPPPIGSLRGVCDAACSSAQSHIGIRVERAQRKRQEGAVRVVAAAADTFWPIITCHITRLNWPEVERNPPEACSSREVSVASAEAFSPPPPFFFSTSPSQTLAFADVSGASGDDPRLGEIPWPVRVLPAAYRVVWTCRERRKGVAAITATTNSCCTSAKRAIERRRGRTLALRRARAKRREAAHLEKLLQKRVRRCFCHRECDTTAIYLCVLFCFFCFFFVFLRTSYNLSGASFSRIKHPISNIVVFFLLRCFSHDGACHDALHCKWACDLNRWKTVFGGWLIVLRFPKW